MSKRRKIQNNQLVKRDIQISPGTSAGLARRLLGAIGVPDLGLGRGFAVTQERRFGAWAPALISLCLSWFHRVWRARSTEAGTAERRVGPGSSHKGLQLRFVSELPLI
jgi:hypothetical protein